MSTNRRPPRGVRMGGYIVTIVVNVILWFVAHNLLRWKLPFITSRFADVLPAVRWSLGATMVANALFLVYDANWFKLLGQAVLNIVAIWSVYAFYRVFPFDFPVAWMDWVARLGMLGVMLALGVATIVEVFRVFFPKE